ncbi:MAG: hypothetical protein KDC67_15475, partial [Ignavibacteriae bacterium]|nr:hypothetical protein [Ignavibacteriota bacterium]
VDRALVEMSKDYQDKYYLDSRTSLMDEIENSLVEASSFRDFNLIEHTEISQKGADTCFQRKEDIQRLLTPLAKVMGYIYETEKCEFNLKLETLQQRHILNLECVDFTVPSLQDSNAEFIVQKVEEIKMALHNVGGSIAVKNTREFRSDFVIQVIFEQVAENEITIEENFELFEL